MHRTASHALNTTNECDHQNRLSEIAAFREHILTSNEPGLLRRN